jgi:RNA polymerase sigma-70 factor (ECF subfamily)
VARGCLANSRRGTERKQRLVRRLVDNPARPGPAIDPELELALAALPERDQELLRLWAWEQLPPREIAVVLGTSANAVSIRLHRATKKLRTHLRKNDAPPGHLEDRPGQEAPR